MPRARYLVSELPENNRVFRAAPPRTFLEKIKDVLANSAVGHAVEQATPGFADMLDLHPTETVNSPDYQAHQNQALSLDQLVDPNQGGAKAVARGVLKGASGMTTPDNLLMMAGAAATGGILGSPLVNKLITAGFSMQQLKGLYDQNQQFRQALASGDHNSAMELLGQMGFNTAVGVRAAHHAMQPTGAPEPAPAQQPAPSTPRIPSGTPNWLTGLEPAPALAGVPSATSGASFLELLKQKQATANAQMSNPIAQAVQAGGGEYHGPVGFAAVGQPEAIQFSDPLTKTTLALPVDQISPENVKAHLEQSRMAMKKGPTPDPRLAAMANAYNGVKGFQPIDLGNVQPDPRAPQIAQAYQAMPHDPSNPQVAASYDALKQDVTDQWNHAVANGIQFEPWGTEGQPYKNSAEMAQDVRNNNHLYFFQGGDMPADHPLAATSPDTGLTYNDMFRAVHDLYGHAQGGYEFGPRGEENAWRTHSQMMSPAALPAMTTETKGQNSWVNFGPHLQVDGAFPAKGEAGFIPPAERPFAEQKAALLPSDFHVRPEDMTTMNHWSFEPNLTQLDPNQFGTSMNLAGQERMRAKDPNFQNRVYLGLDGYREPTVQGRPYQYAANVNPRSFYDIEADPQGIWRSNVTDKGPTAAEKAVADAGYQGYTAPSQQIAASFKPVPVSPVENTARNAAQPQPASYDNDPFSVGNLRRMQGQMGFARLMGPKKFTSIVPPEIEQHLPEGWQGLLKTPRSQQSMLNARQNLTPVDEVAAAMQMGGLSRDWYEKSGPAVVKSLTDVAPEFLPESMQNKFLNLNAAASPGISVEGATADSLETWDNYMRARQPNTLAKLRQVVKPLNFYKKSRQPNAISALSDAAIQTREPSTPISPEDPLSGLKVSSFSGDLRGLDRGTIDRHIAVGLSVEGKLDVPANYLAARSRVSEAASKLGFSVKQGQAAQWVFNLATKHILGKSLTGEVAPDTLDPNDIHQFSRDVGQIIVDALTETKTIPTYQRINTLLRNRLGDEKADALAQTLGDRIAAIDAKAANTGVTGRPPADALGRYTQRLTTNLRNAKPDYAGRDEEEY